MDYFNCNEDTVNGVTTKTIVPWNKGEFAFHIMLLENSVTNRRLREAHLTEEGAAWLANVDAQIATLRTAMDSAEA